MTRYAVGFVMASTLTLAGGSLGAAVLTNGTFETGTFAGWTLTGSGFFIDTDLPSQGNYFAHVKFVAEPGGGGQSSIKQTFTAPASPNNILSVDMGWVGVPGQRSAILRCPSLGTQIDLFTGTETSLPNAWKRYASDITPMLGLGVEIEFFAQGTDTNGMNFWIDNINFIPEPGTLALLAVSGVGLKAIRRRRPSRV